MESQPLDGAPDNHHHGQLHRHFHLHQNVFKSCREIFQKSIEKAQPKSSLFISWVSEQFSFLAALTALCIGTLGQSANDALTATLECGTKV